MSTKLRSTDIEQYFEAKLSDLIPNTTLPVDIHLYFPQNKHIMIFRKRSAEVTTKFLSEYHQKGISQIWVYEDDWPAFQSYLHFHEKMPRSEERKEAALSESIVEASQTAPPPSQSREPTVALKSPAPNEKTPGEPDLSAASNPGLQKHVEEKDPVLPRPTDSSKDRELDAELGASVPPEANIDPGKPGNSTDPKMELTPRSSSTSPKEEFAKASAATSPKEEFAKANAATSPKEEFAKANAATSPKEEFAKASSSHSPEEEFEKKSGTKELALKIVLDEIKHTETLIDMIKSEPEDLKRKIEVTAKTARAILEQSMEAGDFENQDKANSAAQRIVKSILDLIQSQSSPMIGELWNLSSSDPNLIHSTNVATYSVLLALAFGKVEPELLADLALAGLLHDVGVTQLPTQVTTKPRTSYNREAQETYSRHVHAGIEILKGLAPDIPERVKKLILQHHEKFDGTGYPARIQGLSWDSSAQLLAISEHLDTLASGQWDGQKRTYREALKTLETMEKQRSFPEYFNPDVLSAVLRWAETETSREMNEEAVRLAEEKKNQIIKHKKAA